MDVQFEINSSVGASARYVSWAPSPCRIRVSDPSGVSSSSVTIRLTGKSTSNGGEIRFRRNATGSFTNSLTFSIPTNGESVRFFVAGKFGRPSTSDGDVEIEARVGSTRVGAVPLMVRVRKNANTLLTAERDRFLSAFAQLNNQGLGRFTDFREMHTSVSSPQAHGPPGFLPWHRAYLLDLERELQAIDSSVALPYWRFDEAAPNLFKPSFFGQADAFGTVQFSADNPLRFWTTDGVQGVSRRPLFNTNAAPPNPVSEEDTFDLGLPGNRYKNFRSMEGNPHGSAHTSFDGSIGSISTAARDPLFFILHCNVDRLWAKWQRRFDRFDSAVVESYDSNPFNPDGHNLSDTMWPWNGITGGSRPPTAPGGALAVSHCVSSPGPEPRVQDCLDYQGTVARTARMGFDYDDVAFA